MHIALFLDSYRELKLYKQFSAVNVDCVYSNVVGLIYKC